ncbi:fumarylacetoacetate hydrolase family protein [Lacisediminihabitans profunda]|uniref:Fumarylacetoacetate hydrolase family protein n=1 Tax=Lacisediminihabitans profunda TaxID=2594790 RepID=A0A5C8UKQ7_9MICO|nr:fumarylacetoacetate hydrolase family protein [Lacisediminihabitans profunda]TXN28743.1 fumarylacetoacetate hydrolase family protein [Lacisediminihabitans profunda]
MTSSDWTGGTEAALPIDRYAGSLAGRVFNPAVEGPSVVAFREDGVFDLSATFATMRELFEEADPAASLAAAEGDSLGSFADVLANTVPETRDDSKPYLLSPIDLQVVKAAGVTFAVSMLERVIEERARGDVEAAASIRENIMREIGGEFSIIRPGSAEAIKLKALLIEQGLWSQYLEVGIGPDAEIFTKAPILATVGTATEVGVLSTSNWNNPEPEVVLAVASDGRIVGASLGNDVNLRDVEGRSALLLPKAKDNNASGSLGPFIRFFDAGFSLDDVRATTVTLQIEGDDGFTLHATSHLDQISRDPADLVAQLMGEHHQYPDGVVLYLGTMFAPVVDRAEPGQGFTHHVGDVVRISAPLLGTLVNHVQFSERCAPWQFGVAALMANLAERNLL